jgi:hypothetical protein
MNAPPKPPAKNADRKAVAAYYSELRRWAKSLEQWEAELAQREVDLDRDMVAAGPMTEQQDHYGVDDDLLDEPIESEEECDCTTQEAEAGCDCPACEEWRSRRAKKMMARQMEATKSGDEVQWLEALWNLPDKRRKK